MRIVLDTNVLVSALLNPSGNPGQVLVLIATRQVMILLNERVLYEYRDVLRRPKFGFEEDFVDGVLAFLDQIAEHVVAEPLSFSIPDPDDRPFLEVALSGEAVVLVTGNKKDYGKPSHGKLKILSPSEFLQLWNSDRN